MLTIRKKFGFLLILSLLIHFGHSQNPTIERNEIRDKRPVKNTQKREEINWKEKIYYGGNVGLSFYSSGGLIDLSPNVGYKFNKYFSGGLQLIFTNINYRYQNFNYSYRFYGGGVFARALVLNWLFLQAEYDILDVPKDFSLVSKKRVIADVPMAGVGFRNQLGEKSCYYTTIMYEFAPTPNSPYTNGPFGSPLIYRVGFNVNF
jgi:hypothetical protein